MLSSCECCNEPQDCMEAGLFTDQLGKHNFSRKTFYHTVTFVLYEFTDVDMGKATLCLCEGLLQVYK